MNKPRNIFGVQHNLDAPPSNPVVGQHWTDGVDDYVYTFAGWQKLIASVGAKGDKGDTGAKGDKGDAGNDGYTPVKGVDYFDGAQGEQGPKGDTGAQGEQGLSGNDGAPGVKGDTGEQGVQGLPGNDGAPGAKGDTGETGAKGDTGDTGAQGPAGSDADVTEHEATYNHALLHSDALDHAHANKSLLDSYDQSNANLVDAISKKHNEAHNHAGIYEDANANIQAHVTSAHAPSNAQKNSDITKVEIEAKLTGEISSHSHAGGGGESEIVVVKGADTPNSTTTLADVVGLSFTALANKTYIIETWLRWDTSATTVGIKLAVNGPAGPAFVSTCWFTPITTTTNQGNGGNAYDVGGIVASAAFTTNNLAKLYCLFRNGNTQGTFVVRFAAETTGTVTAKIGSVLRYRQVD